MVRIVYLKMNVCAKKMRISVINQDSVNEWTEEDGEQENQDS